MKSKSKFSQSDLNMCLEKELGYLTGVIYTRNTGFVKAIDSSYWLFFDF